MSRLRERIGSGRVLLADGALGSLLMERGLAPGEPPETFCLSHPEILADIVRQYRAAGAEIFQANTFGASPLNLARHGLEAQMADINRAAVEIVRQAGGDGLVWASLGPSGRLLRPYGDTEPEAVRESFAAQARVLVEAGADIIAVETMTDLAEAVLAVEAARAAGADVLLVATMTLERRRKGFFTVMGNTVAQSAAALLAAGADLVGTNCGNGMANVIAIIGEFRQATGAPLVARPNAGLPAISAGRTVYQETPEQMAARLPELLELGVAVVGGCCGTTPEHIRAFRAVLDARPAARG